MDSILETAPYPFDSAMARELHLALAELYPTGKAAVFAAQKSGIPAYALNGDQPSFLVWKEVLQYAATASLTRDVVRTALDEFPRGPRQPFFKALLAGKMPPTNHDGSVTFRKKNDAVTVREALLFHDDLTLPVGRLAGLISALQKLQKLAPAICKLTVTAAGNRRGFGTGFRVGKDWLLTNEHVLYLDGVAPLKIVATFGFDDDGTGDGPKGTTVECDPKKVKRDGDDDWGIVKMKRLPDDKKVPIVSLANSAAPKLDGGAFVIQHPAGDRKRVAYARNQIVYFDSEVVHYLSDTTTGSSGAPVFDEAGRLIALHRAGGTPQDVAGQAPLRKNEGVRIDRVKAAIQKAGIRLE